MAMILPTHPVIVRYLQLEESLRQANEQVADAPAAVERMEPEWR